ncbi:MAG: M20/M25/M40 family metallo-hydrolase [Coriobacteriales bacterium]|jgi:carboxypeptidase PM20D1
MIVLLIILAIIVVLIVVLLVNASRLKPTEVKDPLPPTEVEVGDDAVERFREMLRIPTVWAGENPNADHEPFDRFIPKMKELYPKVFEELELTTIETYGIMLKWKGANPDLDPIILMAHHDVVAANPDEWTHDPFAADIEDGKIYARGSVDTKCILASLFESTSKLLEEGYVPPRDIWICSSNCEEDNGNTAPAMVEYLKEHNINPYMVLDEGGAVVDNPPLGVENPFAVIGVTEKGVFSAFLTVNSKGGHASTPSLEDATAKLVSGFDDIQKNPPKAKLSKPIEAMLKELASYGGFGLKIVFGNLWLFRPLVLSIMKKNNETAAFVRTTYGITELEGSTAANIIPKQAKGTLNVRIDPGENVDIALSRIKARFDDQTEYVLKYTTEPSPISPFENDPAYSYLTSVVHSVYPDAGIAPYVQASSSDSRHFHRICPRTYRFAGILFKGDQRARIHGQDENLDVESYKQGVRFYTELIRNFDRLGK